MAEDLSPTDIRARKFRASRRGYDRAEVGEYLERVAGRVHDLEGELAAINTRLSQLGIAELPDLKEELEDVGVEIQAVLDAAMTAADVERVLYSLGLADLIPVGKKVK